MDPGVGSCPSACQNPNGGADCSSGSCVITCAIGHEDCDGDPGNGCEVSVAQSLDSCGSCSRSCSNDHGEVQCAQGLCSPACASGFGDCDGDASNGCESDLTAASSCGSCETPCRNPHGSTRCQDGRCQPLCAAAYADCDAQAQNGCEASLADDPRHCGDCATQCDTEKQVCKDGSCVMSPCASGRGECDDDASVACETDLSSDVQNCGFCHNACEVANGAAACRDGRCAVAACSGGFDDCDGASDNGCEVDLSTSSDHCGGCQNTCLNANGTTACAAGRCVPQCSSGFGDCDGDSTDGCEAPLDDIDNCGMCGHSCPANGGTPSCEAGVCTTHCDLTGSWALHLVVPVDWSGTTVLAAGNGTFGFWARLDLTQSDDEGFGGSLTPCGQIVPDFRSTIINEKYGVTYPDGIFDHVLPATSASASLSDTTPGSAFSLTRSALLLGVMLTNPLDDPWPTRANLKQVDADADGSPAVTAAYKTTTGYSAVPANSLATQRAQAGYLASRVVFSLNGTLSSCSATSGSATVQHVDSRTIGCLLTNDKTCSTSDADYMDSNAPVFKPRPSSYQLVRVSENAGCAAVRAATP